MPLSEDEIVAGIQRLRFRTEIERLRREIAEVDREAKDLLPHYPDPTDPDPANTRL
jgi:hypothetical protein